MLEPVELALAPMGRSFDLHLLWISGVRERHEPDAVGVRKKRGVEDDGRIVSNEVTLPDTVERNFLAFRAVLDILENPEFNRTYYPTTLGLISLLTLSGNFPHP